MQSGGSDASFRRAYDNIRVIVFAEEIWVAEVIGQARGTTVYYRIGCRLAPYFKTFIYRSGLRDCGFGIIDGSVENIWLSTGNFFVGEHAAAPAAFDIIPVAGSKCYTLLAPVIKILA